MKRSQGKGDPHGPGLTIKKCSQDVEMAMFDPDSGTIYNPPHTHPEPRLRGIGYEVNSRAMSPSPRGRLLGGGSLGADGHLGKLSVFLPEDRALQTLLLLRLEGHGKEESALLLLGGGDTCRVGSGLHGGCDSLPPSALAAPEEKAPPLPVVGLEGINPGSRVSPGPLSVDLGPVP